MHFDSEGAVSHVRAVHAAHRIKIEAQELPMCPRILPIRRINARPAFGAKARGAFMSCLGVLADRLASLFAGVRRGRPELSISEAVPAPRLSAQPNCTSTWNSRAMDQPAQTRHFALEELLPREPFQLDQEKIRECVQNQVILVTGAAGSIGAELCRQIAQFKPAALVAFDMAEDRKSV